MKIKIIAFLFLTFCALISRGSVIPYELGDGALAENVRMFNLDDTELYKNKIPNSEAAEFMLKNVPRFDCPDE